MSGRDDGVIPTPGLEDPGLPSGQGGPGVRGDQQYGPGDVGGRGGGHVIPIILPDVWNTGDVAPPPITDPPPATTTPYPHPSHRTNRTSKQAPRELFVNPAQGSVPIVYGRTKVGGNLVYASVIATSLYLVVAICEGPIQAIESIYFDNTLLPMAGVTHQDYLGTPAQLIDSLTNGSVIGLQNLDANWNTALPGIAYVVFKITTGAAVNGLPNISFVIQGKKIYVPPSIPSAPVYSTNPIWILGDLLSNTTYGASIPLSKINWTGSLTTSAAYCDANIAPTAPGVAPTAAQGGSGVLPPGTYKYVYTYIDGLGNETASSPLGSVSLGIGSHTVSVSAIAVGPAGTVYRDLYRSKGGTTTPLYLVTQLPNNTTTTYSDNTPDASLGTQQAPAAGGATKRFEFDGVLIQAGTLQDWIDAIRSHCQAIITFNGLQYDIICDQPWIGANVFDFTTDNIVDLVVTTKPLKDSPTRVAVEYTDTRNNFKDANIFRELDAVTAGTLQRREAKYVLTGCPTGDQGARTCVYFLNKRLADTVATFSSTQAGLVVLPGDVVSITHPIGFSATQFRIITAEQSQDGSTYNIVAEEYTTAAYSDSIVQVDPGIINNLPDPFAVPPDPTGAGAIERIVYDSNGRASSQLVLSWTPAVYALSTTTRVQMSFNDVNGNPTTLELGRYVNSPAYVADPPYNTLVTFTLYTVVLATNIQSPGVTATITPIALNSIPPDPEGPSISSTGTTSANPWLSFTKSLARTQTLYGAAFWTLTNWDTTHNTSTINDGNLGVTAASQVAVVGNQIIQFDNGVGTTVAFGAVRIWSTSQLTSQVKWQVQYSDNASTWTVQTLGYDAGGQMLGGASYIGITSGVSYGSPYFGEWTPGAAHRYWRLVNTTSGCAFSVYEVQWYVHSTAPANIDHYEVWNLMPTNPQYGFSIPADADTSHVDLSPVTYEGTDSNGQSYVVAASSLFSVNGLGTRSPGMAAYYGAGAGVPPLPGGPGIPTGRFAYAQSVSGGAAQTGSIFMSGQVGGNKLLVNPSGASPATVQLDNSVANGGTLQYCVAEELLTLTSAATQFGFNLPAYSILLYVTARVTTTITTATTWQIQLQQGPTNLSTSNGTRAAGTVSVPIAGGSNIPIIAATSTKIITTGIPGAGAVRAHFWYLTATPPTS